MSALLTQRPRAGHRPPAYSALDPEADRPVVAIAAERNQRTGQTTELVRRTASTVVNVYNHPAITVAEIMGFSRREIVSEARFIAWWVLRHTGRLSEQEIAYEFCRHRSTIAHGFMRLRALMSTDAQVRANADAVKRALIRGTDSGIVEVSWVVDSANLPDDERTVLIALAGGEVWMGYRDAGRWVTVEGAIVGATVIGWAEVPAGPRDGKGGDR